MDYLQECPVCGSKNAELFISGNDYFLSGEDFQIMECVSCGFKFTNPRPEEKDLGKYYESTEYISHSDNRKGMFASVYQMVRKYTLNKKFLLVQRHQSKGEILDIGCATGQFLNYMGEKGWKTSGIEPDTKTRIRAINEFGLSVFPEEQLDIFPKATFDVITMWHVLEHVSDLNGRIEQIKKLLKPNGTFIVAVPNCNSYDAGVYSKYWAGYDLPRHLYHFTKKDMGLLLEKFGFTIVNILPMRFDAFYVSLLSEKYMTGKMRWIPALWNGFWSNVKAGSKNGHSSLIYIIKIK